MKRLIFLLLILLLAVWLGLLIARDPGLAFFSYQKWTVAMPLWFFIVCSLLVLLIAYFILRLWGNMGFYLYRVKSWLRLRRKNKASNKTNRGLIELVEGHAKLAEHYLKEGITQSDTPLINYLALAKAADEQGAYDRSDLYLRQAHVDTKDALAIGITQAQLQLHRGQLEQALATLRTLRMQAPRHALILKLLERVYVHLGDWKNILALLPALLKAKAITREQCQALEKKSYQALLKSCAHLTLLNELWVKIPRALQKEPELIFCYATQRLKHPGQADAIEALLNKTIKKTHDLTLIKLYGIIEPSHAKQQLAHAENWLKPLPNQAILLLTLGRICVRCQLYGKARAYFEDSLKKALHTDTLIEYGKLLEYLGDPALAMKSYRDGLGLLIQTT